MKEVFAVVSNLINQLLLFFIHSSLIWSLSYTPHIKVKNVLQITLYNIIMHAFVHQGSPKPIILTFIYDLLLDRSFTFSIGATVMFTKLVKSGFPTSFWIPASAMSSVILLFTIGKSLEITTSNSCTTNKPLLRHWREQNICYISATFKITQESKLQNFQYRISHNNYKLKLVDSDSCRWCHMKKKIWNIYSSNVHWLLPSGVIFSTSECSNFNNLLDPLHMKSYMVTNPTKVNSMC